MSALTTGHDDRSVGRGKPANVRHREQAGRHPSIRLISLAKERRNRGGRGTVEDMRWSSAVALTLAAFALTACSGAETATPPPAVSASPSAVRMVGPDEADLVLYVSNQSFDDPTVHITLAVDGVQVVDGEFEVQGQHTFVAFPLGLSPGSHSVTAESDSGATLTESFQVPGDAARYALLSYWAEADTPRLEWGIQNEPMYFA